MTVVDNETERLLRDRLSERRPGEHVLGEEGGGRADAPNGGVTWVVDPIDGTVNFVYGLPAYVVSVAAQVGGRSVAGAVANVVDGAVYSAALGHGARVRRGAVAAPLRCSQVTDLSMTLVGTGFGYDARLRRRQAAVLATLLPQVRDIRRFGSAALDLCLVAAGQLDAYFEEDLKVWGWAAGALIAAEAGAQVRLPLPKSGAVGGSGLVVAASPGVDRAFADALRQAGAL